MTTQGYNAQLQRQRNRKLEKYLEKYISNSWEGGQSVEASAKQAIEIIHMILRDTYKRII